MNISDEKLTKEYSRMFNVGKKNIISYGLPRTDLLFKRNSVEDKKNFFYCILKLMEKKYVYMRLHLEKINILNAI